MNFGTVVCLDHWGQFATFGADEIQMADEAIDSDVGFNFVSGDE